MRVDELINFDLGASARAFESELKTKTLDSGLTEAAKIICSDCSKWLKETGGNLFYRGLSLSKFKDPSSFRKKTIITFDAEDIVKAAAVDSLLVKVQVATNRKPTDSPQWLHDAMNENLVKNTGIPFRSQSVFAVGKRSVAENYGEPFAIFPIGDFDYAWSKMMDDPAYTFYLSVMESGFGTTLYYDGGINDAIRSYWTRAVERMHAAGELGPLDYHPSIEGYFRAAGRNEALDIKSGSKKSLYVRIIKDFIRDTKIWTFNRDLKMAAPTTGGDEYSSNEVMVSTKHYYALNCGYARNFYDFEQILKREMKRGNIT